MSGPVGNLMIATLNSSSVNISWIPPALPNGNITDYNLVIVKLERMMEILNVNILYASPTTYQVTNLGRLLIIIFYWIIMN